MANALICDTCQELFPEDAEGSVSGMGTVSRQVNGQRRQEQRRMDTCPACVEGQEGYRRNRYTPGVSRETVREIEARVRAEYQGYSDEESDVMIRKGDDV